MIEIRFYGLRRSGNHAIINWLMSNIPDSTAFHNDAWLNKQDLAPPTEIRGDANDIRWRIVSFEDRDLRIASRSTWFQNATKPDRTVPILLMRDPFNLFASRLRSGMTSPAYFSGISLPLLYIQYAREWSGHTCILGNTCIRISYDQWKADHSYRADILKRLGLSVRDEDIESIPQYGGGSSFDRGLKSGGSKLQTEYRWMHYQNNDQFLRWLRYREIVEFGLNEFTLPPEASEWINTSLLPKSRALTSSEVAALNLLPRISAIFRSPLVYSIANPAWTLIKQIRGRRTAHHKS